LLRGPEAGNNDGVSILQKKDMLIYGTISPPARDEQPWKIIYGKGKVGVREEPLT